MQSRETAPPTDATNYPAMFATYMARSIYANLRRIRRDLNPAPTAENQERALNILPFALRSPTDWPQTRELVLTLAPKLELAGLRGEWLPLLEQGLVMSERCDDAPTAAELRLQIGLLHRLQSRFPNAQTLLTAAVEAFTALGDRRGQARALNQLAYVAWHQHQQTDVEKLAQQALTLLDEGDGERAMSLSALGLAAIEQHCWETAEEHHRAALQIRRRHGDQRQVGWSLQNLDYVLRGQKRYDEAAACFEQAIAALTEFNDTANLAIVQMNLGVVYSMTGKPDKALGNYAAAEVIFRQLGDSWNLAKVLTSIDSLGVQNRQQAEHAFEESIELFDKLGDTSEYLNALDGLGISYLEQSIYDKAIACFEAVVAQLPQIAGTRAYPLLSNLIDSQLARARAGREHGSSGGPHA